MPAHTTTTSGQENNENVIGPFAVVPKMNCPHLDDRVYTTQVPTRSRRGEQPPCTDCGERDENWVCLEENCSQIGCSRYKQKHMLAHHESTGHRICFSLSDHSFFCFACDSYIDSPKFAQLNEQFLSTSS